MGWKLLVGFVVALVLIAGGLAWYGSSAPQTHAVEQVIPDNKLPK
jgi:hypothetical protein